MDAVDDVVAESARSERAAVADAVAEDPPGVRQLIAIPPDDPRHVAEVAGLGDVEAEGQGHQGSAAGSGRGGWPVRAVTRSIR